LVDAASSTIDIVPGFPNDSAKATGGNFTPFAVFFANPTTMYVSVEGTGNNLDVTSNAGLQKWILGSDGSWHLQYVLTKGLIGVVDVNVTGSDGPWPAITTIGLRNLTGRINRDGTVTLWATTSTSSASGDNGADPNKVVEITDQIAATQSSQVENESFMTVAGPVYGAVFRGVGFVE
jgi:glucose/arabinose dehydrogenase